MTERYVKVVVRAALEDLVSARLAAGVDSAQYRLQQERSLQFIRGSLEQVLQAAHDELSRCAPDRAPDRPAEGARDGCRRPT
jgi:hypothetical protein